MIILDTNILIYAFIPDLPQHERVAAWLESTLSKGRPSIGIIWHVLGGFMRITTNPRVFEDPLSIAAARSHIDDLLSHPFVSLVHTTDRHWEISANFVTELNVSGDVVMDAHIAAMAIENNASVASADKDFRRFSDYVKIIDPLKA
ncbi:MAG: TA system VapC family ribonuclease toxin [Pyrinomonadaceae bacterium]